MVSFEIHSSLFIYIGILTWNRWLRIEWAWATRHIVCRCSKITGLFCYPLFLYTGLFSYIQTYLHERHGLAFVVARRVYFLLLVFSRNILVVFFWSLLIYIRLFPHTEDYSRVIIVKCFMHSIFKWILNLEMERDVAIWKRDVAIWRDSIKDRNASVVARRTQVAFVSLLSRTYVSFVTGYCIWSVILPISQLNQCSSSLPLFCHVPLKRDQFDWDSRLRLNDTPIAIGCTLFSHSM